MNVLFPAPLLPNKPNISPLFKWISIFLRTTLLPKDLDIFLADESARIYNDVIILNEENSNLYADSVYYDFENRVYTVNMFSDNESVKIKLIK